MTRPEWSLGVHFVEANGLRSFWYFTIARWACMPLVLLGSITLYRWGAELWGTSAGVLALVLWTFSPTVIGNGALITPDTAAAAVGVTANYAFWRWWKSGAWSWSILAGIGLGFAELTKATWLILFVLWPVLGVCLAPAGRPLARRRRYLQVVVVTCIGIYILNAGYGFKGTFRQLGSFSFRSELLGGRRAPAQYSGNRFAGSWLGRVPLPLPADEVLGIDLQRIDFEQKSLMYLGGEHRQGSWWYYYLYATALKEPLGILLLAALALAAAFRRSEYRLRWREELMLAAPGIAVLLLVSSHTGLSYYRYLLPALPMLYLSAARVGRAFSLSDRRIAIPACISTVAVVVSSLGVFPHSFSYFNELAGGPRKGHNYLISACIDWGQDSLYLRRWAEVHQDLRPLYVDLTGMLHGRHFGLDGTDPPGEQVPGWYAISVSRLYDPELSYQRLLDRQPDHRVGYTVYVFRLGQKNGDPAASGL